MTTEPTANPSRVQLRVRRPSSDQRAILAHTDALSPFALQRAATLVAQQLGYTSSVEARNDLLRRQML